jgi:asparagine synthase (glutamine-hydrolysing)
VLLGQRLSVLPEFLRRGFLLPFASALPRSLISPDQFDHLRRFLGAPGDPAEQYESYMSTGVSERLVMLPGATPSRRVMEACRRRQRLEPLERALRADLEFYLPDDILTLTDRISMWHSLELRVPFLDRKLVEFAAALPTNAKVRGRTQKWLLRRVASRWLPKSMLEHRKQGFEAPMGEWLRGPLLPLFDSVVNEQSVRRLAMLDWNRLRALRAEHVAGRFKHSKVLFSAFMLQAWAAARVA